MRFVQCYLRTALLRTEPECSEQAEENVQQQESHTHHIVTDVIGPCLLVVATNILERTYLRNEDIAYAELALTVCLQPLNEVIVLPFTDADNASGYAVEALRWAVEKGILNGFADGRLAPGGTATRAQAAQLLKNFMENT